jgi:hypothetical protein
MFKKLLFLLFISQNLLAIGKVSLGGIKGIIKNEKGEVMPFASVLVKGTDIGTMANEEGAYEVKLKSGQYEVFFNMLAIRQLSKKLMLAKLCK